MKKPKVVCTLSQEDLPLLEAVNPDLIDLIEIRLDLFTRDFIANELITYLEQLNKNYIFTYRLPEDSSESHFTELSAPDVHELLLQFESPLNFIDCELNRDNKLFSKFEHSTYGNILSWHDFSRTIDLQTMENIIRTKSEKIKNNTYFKFAVMPHTYEETALFLSAIKELSGKYNMIGICMGEKGSVSRIFGDFYGSAFTYCSLGQERAPGQIPVKTFHLFRNF